MNQKRPARQWLPHEDEQLRKAVDLHGTDDWRLVAESVDGRDNKACRKRWKHSLRPDVKKTKWTAEEDEILVKLRKEGRKWADIAREIPGRTDDSCSKRFNECLDPDLKKADFTQEDDFRLTEMVLKYGDATKDWKQIGAELGRGTQDCRNRWRKLDRKQASLVRAQAKAPSGESLPSSLGNEQVSPPVAFQELQIAPIYLHSPIPDFNFSETQLSEPTQDTSQFYASAPWSFDFPPTPPLTESQRMARALRSAASTTFTSSSLSTALSAPTQSRPLPSEHDFAGYGNFRPTSSFSQPQSLATSPFLHPNSFMSEDVAMSQVDNMDSRTDTQLDDLDVLGNLSMFMRPSHYQPHLSYNADTQPSPISPGLINLPGLVCEPWKSPDQICVSQPLQEYSPSLLRTDISSISELQSSVPSLVSTPSTALHSAATSPSFSYALDLPSPLSSGPTTPEHNDGSLLLSQSRPLAGPTRTNTRKKAAKAKSSSSPDTPAPAHKLLSTLRFATDIRAYGCGYPDCLQDFYTAADLSLHLRADHNVKRKFSQKSEQEQETAVPGKPMRCSLANCEKRFSTLNGIMAHLQSSDYHFSGALRKTLEEDEKSKKHGKVSCNHPGCFKLFASASGLRYHQMAKHKSAFPTQIPELPPVIARKAQELREAIDKPKRPRPKPPPEHSPALSADQGLQFDFWDPSTYHSSISIDPGTLSHKQ